MQKSLLFFIGLLLIAPPTWAQQQQAAGRQALAPPSTEHQFKQFVKENNYTNLAEARQAFELARRHAEESKRPKTNRKLRATAVNTAAYSPNATAETFPYTENFEGVTPPALPTGITTSTLATDGGFFTATSDDPWGTFPDYPGQFAISDDDACGSDPVACDKSEDFLILPSIDMTGSVAPQLRFNYLLRDITDFFTGIASGDGTVEVSTDGGTTFTEIDSLPVTGNAFAFDYTIDLSTFSSATDLIIRFKFNDEGVFGWGMAVDNIAVAEPLTNEVVLEEIVSPMSLETGGCDTLTENISVAVTNNGASAASFPVSVTVTAPDGSETTLTTDFTNLATSTTDTLVVGAFTFDQPGNYVIDGVTSLVGDENPNNDSASATVANAIPYTLPYAEGFDDADGLPAGFIGDGFAFGSTIGVDGTPGIRENLWAFADSATLTLPNVEVPVGALGFTLSFDYRIANFIDDGPVEPFGDNVIYFYLATDACDDDGPTYTLVDSIYSGNYSGTADFTNFSIPVTGNGGNTVSFLIEGLWDSGDFNVDLDNFSVSELLQTDVAVSAPNPSVEPYTFVPMTQALVPVEALVSNVGADPLTGVSVTANIMPGNVTQTITVGDLATGADTLVMFDDIMADNVDYEITFSVTTNETDGNADNNTADVAFTFEGNINPVVYAWDVGALNGSLGNSFMSGGTNNVYAQRYEVKATDTLRSVTARLRGGAQNMPLYGVVYSFGEDGLPGDTIAFSDTITLEDITERWYTIPFGDEGIELTPGQYAVGIVEAGQGQQIGMSFSVDDFVPGTSFTYWDDPADPNNVGGWIATEDLFSGSFIYLVRANFGAYDFDLQVVGLQTRGSFGYVQIPAGQDSAAVVVQATNAAAEALTNVSVAVDVNDGEFTDAVTEVTLPTATALTFETSTFVPTVTDYTITATGSSDDTDLLPDNNADSLQLTYVATVGDSVYAYESGANISGSLVGGFLTDGTNNVYGMRYDIFTADTITSVSFILEGGDVGTETFANVYAFNELGEPEAVVATTETIDVTTADETLYTAYFNAEVILQPGTYLVGVVEEDGEAEVGMTFSTPDFFPGVAYTFFDGTSGPNGTPWTLNEDLFVGSFIYSVRANFGRLSLDAVDLALEEILSPTGGCGLSAEAVVEVVVANEGADPITSFGLGYTLDGGTDVTETFTETIAPGMMDTVSFTQTVDLSATGDYELVVFVDLDGDTDSGNDTLSVDISSGEAFAIDLNNSVDVTFEPSEAAEVADWTVLDLNNDGSTWELIADVDLNPELIIEGTKSAYYFYNEDAVTPADDWMITNCYQLEAGEEYAVSFAYKVAQAGGTVFPERFLFALGTAPDPAAMTTLNDFGEVDNNAPITYTDTITVDESGVYHLGWYCYSTPDQFALSIDEFTVELVGEPAPPARVQVIHNAPLASATTVDVYANDLLVADDLDFRSATAFINAPSEVPVAFGIAPANSTSSGNAIFTAPAVTLNPEQVYIAVANSNATDQNSLQINVFDQAQEEAADPTTVDVLVHHGSADAPAVRVVEISSDPDLDVTGLLNYTDFEGYATLAAQDGYILDIRDGSDDLLASFDADLDAFEGAAITVIASGLLNATGEQPGFGLFVAGADGGDLVALPLNPGGSLETSLGRAGVYPNPATGWLEVNSGGAVLKSVELYDVLGRTVLTANPDIRSRLDVSSLPAGQYYVRLRAADAVRVIPVEIRR